MVYVIQAPAGKNLEPAKKFGELTVMLNGDESTDEACRKLEFHFKNWNFHDRLLLIGHPIFICLASGILSFKYKQIIVLVWDREHQIYVEERIDW